MLIGSIVTLSNSFYTLGIDLQNGASISYLSVANSSFNVINTWDAGRLIQQSYYGDGDGSFWDKRPWMYNPVQGGCYKNVRSQVVQTNFTDTQFSSRVIPTLWSSCQPAPEATMISQINLNDDVVAIKFSMVYRGKSSTRARHQEIPAVFVDRSLSQLAFYNGSQPWTNGTLSYIYPSILQGGSESTRIRPTEKWAAYLNPRTGIGLGVFSPNSELMTSYRVGTNDINPAKSDTSYLAPLMTRFLIPNTIYTYDVYLKIGKPYRCARDDYDSGILLDANENAYGHGLKKELNLPDPSIHSDFHLERYPDPHQANIKSRLVQLKEIDSIENIFLGVGSDECIDIAIRIFCQPGKDKILICPPTYGMYSVCAQVNDVQVIKTPLLLERGAFQLDVPAIMETIQSEPDIKIIFLCSPGNPTGTLLSKEDVQKLLEFKSFKGVIIVDEAYIDFCPRESSVVSWIKDYPNLIVTQTLSKAFGLAGIRLGISVASPEITQIFNNTKAPYNISTPTSLIAKSALSPESVIRMQKNVDMIIEQRGLLIEKLKAFPGIGSILGGNHANFVLVEILNAQGEPCNETAMHVYKTLAEKMGIVVRFRGKEMGCFGCLRITVGTEQENTILLENLAKVL